MPDGSLFQRGNFAPIECEYDLPDLPVTGTLPHGLCGTLFRNGPNPQFNDGARCHWFFGDGMVHAFTLSEGRAAYRNRWVRTAKWRAEHAAGRPLLPDYPRPSLRGLAIPDTGVANTNVVWHAGKLLALEEGHMPHELDPATLETRGVERFRGILNSRFTAHPKTDPSTGELLFFGYATDGPMTATMSWGTVQTDGRIGRLEHFGVPYCALVHDFAITARHILFPLMPLTGSLWRAVTRGQPFAWEPDRGGHVGLMRREGGVATLRWFHAPSCYVFHVLNAWDEGERVIADVMQYETPPFFPTADGRPADQGSQAAHLVRWTLDPAAGTDALSAQLLDEAEGEFPRIDERRTGLPNRHGAYLAGRGESGFFRRLVWRDMATGAAEHVAVPEEDALSEAVFVPRHAMAAEGDGWLLTIAWRGEERRSDLLVLDTSALAEGPVAVVRLPHRIPFGFHGNWVPEAA